MATKKDTHQGHGYVDCSCRDCFDVAVCDGKSHLCSDCAEAGCEPNDGECKRPDAYGAGDHESEDWV